MALPAGGTYLVKSELGSISDLVSAVENSISNLASESVKPVSENDRILISAIQGEVLKLEANNLDEMNHIRGMDYNLEVQKLR
jgi:hypothetical protein